jgi:hypothetical protein
LPGWPQDSYPPLHRAVAVRFDQPWWFSSRDGSADPGRYDLRSPNGTCYWYDQPAGALLERLVDPDTLEPIIASSDLDLVRLWTIAPTRLGPVADITDRRSRVPKELSTTVPYNVEPGPWQWADALTAARWEGLVGWTRMDPSDSRTVALFGPAGTDPPTSYRGSAPVAVPARNHADDLDGWLVWSPVPGSGDLEVLP